jgi:hypothetical protein
VLQPGKHHPNFTPVFLKKRPKRDELGFLLVFICSTSTYTNVVYLVVSRLPNAFATSQNPDKKIYKDLLKRKKIIYSRFFWKEWPKNIKTYGGDMPYSAICT